MLSATAEQIEWRALFSRVSWPAQAAKRSSSHRMPSFQSRVVDINACWPRTSWEMRVLMGNI
jgi:hypothetical protein